MRLDAQGQRLWEQSFRARSYDDLFAVRQEQDGGFVLAGSSFLPASSFPADQTQGWLVRLDAAGQTVWRRSYVANGWLSFRAVEPLADGGYVVGGLFQALNPSGSGRDQGDIWIGRMDPNGIFLWQQTFLSPADDHFGAMQLTADGGIIFGGGSTGSGSRIVRLKPDVPENCDEDGDGVPDLHDLCPGTTPGSVVNSEGCSIDQLVPCDGPWKNHGQYLKAMEMVTEDFVRDGLITPEQRQTILNQAARSNCGKR